MRRWSRIVLAGAAVAACVDEHATGPGSPRFDILDAAHGSGNAHFYFLPPMVSPSTPNGTFDGSQSPVVDICEWNGSACVPPLLAEFTTTTGTGGENVRLDPSNEVYTLKWRTDQFTLDASKTYRIRVLVFGNYELGHADVDVVNSGSQLKNVQTGQFIPLLDGRTLP